MARSQQAYNQIRTLASNNEWNVEKQSYFNQLIKDLESKEPTNSTLTTAYQHVWGYFKKICTEDEKIIYKKYLSKLSTDNDDLGPYLVYLTDKYKVKYLEKSRIIQELKKRE
ncbi:YbgA family protein [Apilactobacillus sp. TMW 2.2459]|uniref:DUF1722 domain-containing protein n=1 Tax=Apilactobacillus xinyiensis TaxID=2841032 RepID=UPI00200F7D79|nr:DUF1722 domain-containing protein [Apilactobacillus xinyiensis]MCL0312445.1 YbgA family protein [Apilactobacillus xinyiensis]